MAYLPTVHLVDFYGKCMVNIPYMDPMGNEQLICRGQIGNICKYEGGPGNHEKKVTMKSFRTSTTIMFISPSRPYGFGSSSVPNAQRN